MRLGQLARKYDVSLQEILSYLKEIDPARDELHPNAKLDEHTELLVVKHFEHLMYDPPEYLEEQKEEETSEKIEKQAEPDTNYTEESVPQSELVDPLPETRDQQNEDVTIETNRLLELLESDETPVDLSKITHIKAPKKELDGLKVVGKIELPEPKRKVVEKGGLPEGEIKQGRKSRHQPRQISEEESEKRRLSAKKKQDAYEARQEIRRKEKEKKQKKAIKEAHYRQKLQRTTSNLSKHKEKAQKQYSSSKVENQRPRPRTLLGKFWRWMNT